MSEAAGHSRPTGAGEAPIEAAQGEQVLLTLEPMTNPLRLLPAEAFENLLVVATGHEPAAIERAVADLGHDPGDVGIVPVSASPISAGGEAWTAPRVGPGDLTGVSIGAARGMPHLRPGHGHFVVDNVSVLFMHAKAPRVCQLVDTLAAKCRLRDVTGVFGVVPAAVDDEAFARVGSVLDTAIDRQ